jgi:hypothetical protein
VTEISHWLACPLHNRRPELAILFAELCRYRRELDIEPDPAELLQRMRPGRPFRDRDWRQVQHQLLACLEDWLCYRRYRERAAEQRLDLVAAYRARGLDRHLRNRLKRAGKAATQSPPVAVEDYRHRYLLERERYRQEAGTDRGRDHNLREQEQALLRYWLAQKLRQTCQTLAHLRVYRMELDIPLLAATLQAARAIDLREEPGLYLYYLAAQLYLENGESDAIFAELVKGLQASIDRFPPEERRNLLLLAINHGLRNSNAGQAAYLRQTFDLYRLGVDQAVLYERGELSIFTFNNIIGVALRLGEIDWAAAFLAAHERRLPADRRAEVLALNRARLAFQRGDYDAALRLLQEADYRDFIHHMTARVMQLKIYCERNHYNLLTAHLRSSRTWLRRQRHVGYHQTNYQHIFDLTEQLVRLPPGDKTAARALADRIRRTEPCTERAWLLAQVRSWTGAA